MEQNRYVVCIEYTTNELRIFAFEMRVLLRLVQETQLV